MTAQTIFSRLRCQERAEDMRRLGAPQPFRLSGDGEYTQKLHGIRSSAAALAEARYLDWLKQRSTA